MRALIPALVLSLVVSACGKKPAPPGPSEVPSAGGPDVVAAAAPDVTVATTAAPDTAEPAAAPDVTVATTAPDTTVAEAAPDTTVAAAAPDTAEPAAAPDVTVAPAALVNLLVAGEDQAPGGGLAAPWKALMRQECKKGEDFCEGAVVHRAAAGGSLENVAVLRLVHGSELGPEVIFVVAVEDAKGWRILDGVLADLSQGDGGRYQNALAMTAPAVAGQVVTFTVHATSIDTVPDPEAHAPEGSGLGTVTETAWWCWSDDKPQCVALPVGGRAFVGPAYETAAETEQRAKETGRWQRVAALQDATVTVGAVEGKAPPDLEAAAGPFVLATAGKPFVRHLPRK